MMPPLDCNNEHTALNSVARIVGLSPDDLQAVLWDISPEELSAIHAGDSHGFVGHSLMDLVVDSTSQFEPPAMAAYFHGCRCLPEADFSEGLLPKAQMLDRIWSDLARSLPEVGDGRFWKQLRADMESRSRWDGGYNEPQRDLGPFAFQIRAVWFPPCVADQRFIRHGPELVRLICKQAEKVTGVSASNLYQCRTQPCIVKFLAAADLKWSVPCALYYLHASLHECLHKLKDGIDFGAFHAGGHAISPHDIVCVERLSHQELAP